MRSSKATGVPERHANRALFQVQKRSECDQRKLRNGCRKTIFQVEKRFVRLRECCIGGTDKQYKIQVSGYVYEMHGGDNEGTNDKEI